MDLFMLYMLLWPMFIGMFAIITPQPRGIKEDLELLLDEWPETPPEYR